MNVGENNTVTISVEEYRKLLEIQATQSLIIRFFHRNLLSSCAKSMKVQFTMIV